MPAFNEVFIHKTLQPVEYDQLISKGYFKLKIQLTLEHLRMFQSQYRVGDAFKFRLPSNTDIETAITSIDTGEPHGDTYTVFIGFTLM
jgi:hypothetical protein